MYVGLSQSPASATTWPPPPSICGAARSSGEHTGLPQNPYRWRVAMARLREAEGDLDGALELLDEAQRVYVGDFSPNVRPVPALRARVLAAQGRWARRSTGRASTACPPTTTCRTCASTSTSPWPGSSSRGTRPTLRRAASTTRPGSSSGSWPRPSGRRTGSVIEILVLQALAHHAGGDTPAALAPLERALTLAEPEGYVRVFVGEGPPMAALLKALAKQRAGVGYVRRLLAAVPDDGPQPAGDRRPHARVSSSR